jgi:hypothetical protein
LDHLWTHEHEAFHTCLNGREVIRNT